MDDLLIKVNGESILLDGCGAAFSPSYSTLMFADLHLEKGSAFASRGRLLTSTRCDREQQVAHEVKAERSPQRPIQRLHAGVYHRFPGRGE